MVYLRYIFDESGLATPNEIACFIDEPVDWLVAQISAEFQTLFPNASIYINPPQPTNTAWHLLVYRDKPPSYWLAWADARQAATRTAIGLYDIGKRRLQLVPADQYKAWRRREGMAQRLMHSRRQRRTAWTNVGALCEFFS